MKTFVVNAKKQSSYVKDVLFEMQQNEKKLAVTYDQEITEGVSPILKQYIQYLKNKSVKDLSMYKTFLSKLIESPLTNIETRVMIKEFIEHI